MNHDPSNSKLFSQENPNLYFHKSPAKGKQMPDLSGKHVLLDTAYSRQPNPLSPDSREADEFVKNKRNVHNLTSEQMKHKLYVQPLMKFFHECIDFERTMEINKQELVLQEDYSIYNVFKSLAGPGKKFLPLCDL